MIQDMTLRGLAPNTQQAYVRAVELRVRDVDAERRLIRVEQGKGARDRTTLLSPRLLEALRAYGPPSDPQAWLFPSRSTPCRHLTPAAAKHAFWKAKRRAGIQKPGGLHTLRHSWATHLLVAPRAAGADWVVYAKPPFAGPESVLRYLGRYTHRVALSNRRIVRAGGRTVAFRYRDRADVGREKTLTLPVHELIRRFLLHVLPPGFVCIRHAGLLANRTRREQIARCRALLQAEPPPPPPPADETVCEKLLRLTGRDLGLCPACGEGRMEVVAELDPTRFIGLDSPPPGIDSS
jgi:hypothetical protein